MHSTNLIRTDTDNPCPESVQIETPFERLRPLLEGVKPEQSAMDLTLGEPRHPIPSFIENVLVSNIDKFGRYPPIKGTREFREAIAGWLDKRYHLEEELDVDNGILPLNGSREGLFLVALQSRSDSAKNPKHPVILIPNPFYRVYSAAAHAAGCEIVHLDTLPENEFLPDLSSISTETLDRTIAIYLASPSNPQGSVASESYWQNLIDLSRKHAFNVLADECYSEIYREKPPCGLLEAAKKHGGFKGLISFNSLSKRSNLPGMRLGFAAGDPEFLANWAKFRGVAAPQVPLPLQTVAEVVYKDEKHVEENRRLYNRKFEIAREKLEHQCELRIPEGGFFIWLNVEKWGVSDIEFARELWTQAGVRVLPGSFLALENSDGQNPGKNYIRIAMVESTEATTEAFSRISQFLSGLQQS